MALNVETAEDTTVLLRGPRTLADHPSYDRCRVAFDAFASLTSAARYLGRSASCRRTSGQIDRRATCEWWG